MSKIVSKEEAIERINKQHNFTIQIENYINFTTKAVFICKTCGYEWSTTPQAVAGGNGCRKCSLQKISKRFSHNFDYVKQAIENRGYSLLSEEYINEKEKIKIKCDKGHEVEMTFDSFNRGRNCLRCAQIKKNLAKRVPFEVVMQYLNEDGYEFIGFPNGYENRLSTIEYKCQDGHVNSKKLREYLKCRNCTECTLIKQSKLKYSKELKKIKISLRYFLLDWKKMSMINCNYKCVVTGQRTENVHHLYSFSNIVTDVLLETNELFSKNFISEYTNDEINIVFDKIINIHLNTPLGVCITKKAHHIFHKEYGYGNNTQEQFNEFLERVKNKEIIID